MGAGEAAVEVHALAFGIDVGLGEDAGDADVDVDFLRFDDIIKPK